MLCKCLMNLITNANPVYIQTITRDLYIYIRIEHSILIIKGIPLRKVILLLRNMSCFSCSDAHADSNGHGGNKWCTQRTATVCWMLSSLSSPVNVTEFQTTEVNSSFDITRGNVICSYIAIPVICELGSTLWENIC
jgi:hypothetical protein